MSEKSQRELTKLIPEFTNEKVYRFPSAPFKVENLTFVAQT